MAKERFNLVISSLYSKLMPEVGKHMNEQGIYVMNHDGTANKSAMVNALIQYYIDREGLKVEELLAQNGSEK